MVSKKLPASLFVGAPGTGKRTLVSKIIGKQLTSSDSCGQWLIDNAYYAANTKVVIRRPDGSKFGSLTGYDAIILVFDATQQDTWHAVSAWAESNADALEQTEIALVCGVGWISHTWYTLHPSPAMANKQVVANKYDLVQTQQQHGAGDTSSSSTNKQGCSEWLEEVQDWCLEHHCEYIRAAAAHAPTDNSLASDVEDPEGTARVRSALEAHTWPGLELKATPDRGGGGGGGGGGEAPGGLVGGPPAAVGVSTVQAGHDDDHANNCSSNGGGADAGGGAAPAAPRTRDDALAYLLRGTADGEGEGGGIDGEGAGAGDDEGVDKGDDQGGGVGDDVGNVDHQQLAAMEALFADMAAARETLDGMEDEDRRDAAARLALRLAEMFGLEDEEESEEQGESEEKGESEEE